MTISADAIAGNDVVSAAEAAAGITLTGTTQPGSTVSVDVAGVTRTATVAADGNWTVTFAAGSLPNGSYDATATASATDAAGNLVTTTRDFRVDTETAVSIADTGAGTDGVLNAAERAAGIITGQAEPGSTAVAVTLNGVTHTATIAADGRWQVAVAAADLPTGERDLAMTVTATDHAGNSASADTTLTLDTVVNRLTSGTDAGGADRVINATEHRDGVVIRGQVEPGSTVMVALGATRVAASVAADGTWTASFAAAQVPMGDRTVPVTATATDAAGNIRNSTVRLDIDTDVPDAASIENYTRDHTGIIRIGVDTTGDDLTVAEVRADGSIVDNRTAGLEVPVLGETLFSFAPAVPDGSHLIVNAADAAGNTSGTYLVFDELTTSVVDLPAGLGAYQIDAIDLQFAEDSQLTITEAQLLGLSSNSNSLLIHGGTDDTVTARGAERVTGSAGSVEVAGQGYVVYTLGADGRLIIDEDIQVLI